jgi:hypothetical protein
VQSQHVRLLVFQPVGGDIAAAAVEDESLAPFQGSITFRITVTVYAVLL